MRHDQRMLHRFVFLKRWYPRRYVDHSISFSSTDTKKKFSSMICGDREKRNKRVSLFIIEPFLAYGEKEKTEWFRHESMISNEFQAFEFDVGERNRSSELYNELHRPIRKGKIRGAISWKVKRGWKKGCGNYAYDLRNDSCVQRIQPSPLLPFFPTLLPLPLFFTAHVLIISSRSKPSLSRPKIHVS